MVRILRFLKLESKGFDEILDEIIEELDNMDPDDLDMIADGMEGFESFYDTEVQAPEVGLTKCVVVGAVIGVAVGVVVSIFS